MANLQLTDKAYKDVTIMAAALSVKSGRKVSRAKAVERGIQALKDNHAESRWLTGEEAGTVMQERHEQSLLRFLGTFVSATMPGHSLKDIGFDREAGVAYVTLNCKQPGCTLNHSVPQILPVGLG